MSENNESESLIEACPGCGGLLDVTEQEPYSSVFCPSCGTQMKARTQFRNFRLLNVLGTGGMGTVFRAQDMNLQRDVALKILRKEYSSNPEDVGRIEREARITASVNHPNVIKIYSFGNDHGQFFLAMEIADKGSLDDLMGLQGTIAELQVLEIGMQVASGLDAAWNSGLIHRDVKPGNILFTNAHMTKIVDFGLALLMDEEAAQRGEIWGTPYYIAPEKLDNRGEDFRSDLYSLGATMFHAIAGRPPYEANTASMVALKHLKSLPVSLQAFAPNVSSETSYVINRMLHKDPEERYQSYGEVIEHMKYAQDQINAKLAKSGNKGRERVVVETEESVSAMGWLSLALLLFVIAGIVFLVMNWGQITGNAPLPTGAPVEDNRRNLTEEDLAIVANDEFNDARQMMGRGEFEQAHAIFKEVKSSTAEEGVRRWSMANEILTGYLTGRIDDADSLFARFGSGKLKKDDPEQVALENSIDYLASKSSDSSSIPVEALKELDKTDAGIFAVLLAGVKNWVSGFHDDAAVYFEAFDRADLPSNLVWLGDYRVITRAFLQDYGLLTEAREIGRAAIGRDINARRQAMVKINALRGKLVSGSDVLIPFDKLIEDLERE
jgi:serine/threonine protein kinase